MGIWDFVKDAGKAIGIGSAEAATPDAEELKKEVEELGLDAKDLDIEVEGDTVKVKGRAATQAEKEKVILAVGNVAGVAKVEDDIAAEEPGGEPVFHTVAKGDNLWKISEKYLDSGSRYTEIFEANKPMLTDPDKIYPGQVLRIPQT
jgi:nucleoid-associated protein YgaU